MEKSHWRLWFGFVQTAYVVIRGILDLVGYVDTFLAHENSPNQTWLGKVMSYFLAPPPWMMLPLLLIGLGFIWWDLKRSKPKKITQHIHHVPLSAQSAQKVSLTAEVLRTTSDPVPDWPIRDLAFHVKPDILETSEQDEYSAVFDEIADKFSTGQLRCWGRAIINSDGLPLALIPPVNWQHLKLNPWLLDKDGGKVLQAARRKNHSPVPQYTDLQVNRAQALGLWPSRVASKAGAADISGRSGKAIRILSPDETSGDRLREDILGMIDPPNCPVQLLISSEGGDYGRWFLQRKPVVEGSNWTAKDCYFGGKDDPNGTHFRIIALDGALPIQTEQVSWRFLESYPGLKSSIVTVRAIRRGK